MFICKIYSYLFFGFSIILFFSSLYLNYFDLTYIIEYNLFSINSSSVIITLLIDWISLIFIRFVLFISSIVIFYRDEYILGDLNLNRFILLVVIFVLSIILLIISPNLIRILLGWDGLGLVSYCLVIYYQNIKSFNAGIITALTNRIGDVILLISIAWILNYGRWNYVFYLDCIKNDFSIQFISLIIVIAAITKRAQIPFSSWLPAAIAAPTPVSSLVHSSTLVTAGVYLLIRFNFALNDNLIIVLLFISSLTIFISGIGANFEFDLKKIIALSTLSQLGLIIRILRLGDYKLAFFHLLTHALFKALLFICAGNIIHNISNCQDIRYIGNLVKILPLTCTYLNISNLSLCGLPFLSGFYSKDLVVEFISIGYLNIYIYVIFYISIGLTVSYRFRLTYYSLLGNFNFIRLNIISESSYTILKGIRGLIIFVIFSGRISMWIIFSTPYFICLPLIIKLITLIIIVIGIVIGLEFSKIKLRYTNLSLKRLTVREFLASIWNIPFISTFGINYYFLKIGKNYIKYIDQGWSEYFGRQNLGNNLINSSKFFQILFKNNLKIYLVLILIWFIFIILNFIYLYSLNLEHNIEDIRVILLFVSIYKIKSIFILKI